VDRAIGGKNPERKTSDSIHFQKKGGHSFKHLNRKKKMGQMRDRLGKWDMEKGKGVICQDLEIIGDLGKLTQRPKKKNREGIPRFTGNNLPLRGNVHLKITLTL